MNDSRRLVAFPSGAPVGSDRWRRSSRRWRAPRRRERLSPRLSAAARSLARRRFILLGPYLQLSDGNFALLRRTRCVGAAHKKGGVRRPRAPGKMRSRRSMQAPRAGGKPARFVASGRRAIHRGGSVGATSRPLREALTRRAGTAAARRRPPLVVLALRPRLTSGWRRQPSGCRRRATISLKRQAVVDGCSGRAVRQGGSRERDSEPSASRALLHAVTRRATAQGAVSGSVAARLQPASPPSVRDALREVVRVVTRLQADLRLRGRSRTKRAQRLLQQSQRQQQHKAAAAKFTAFLLCDLKNLTL